MTTYYHLNKSAIIRWGGWRNEQVFEQNSLGRESDELAAELMDEAGLH